MPNGIKQRPGISCCFFTKSLKVCKFAENDDTETVSLISLFKVKKTYGQMSYSKMTHAEMSDGKNQVKLCNKLHILSDQMLT